MTSPNEIANNSLITNNKFNNINTSSLQLTVRDDQTPHQQKESTAPINTTHNFPPIPTTPNTITKQHQNISDHNTNINNNHPQSITTTPHNNILTSPEITMTTPTNNNPTFEQLLQMSTNRVLQISALNETIQKQQANYAQQQVQFASQAAAIKEQQQQYSKQRTT